MSSALTPHTDRLPASTSPEESVSPCDGSCAFEILSVQAVTVPVVLDFRSFRAVFVGIEAVVLLCLAGSMEPARGTPRDAPELSDSLTAATVAFALRYDAPSPDDSSHTDPWIARDKGQHAAFSALWTLSTQYLLVNKAGWTEGEALPASIASTSLIGVGKEVYDASRSSGTASGRDLVADGAGIGFAVLLIVL